MKPTKSPIVLVCVFDHTTCRQLIRAGQALAEQHQLPLEVMSVQPKGLVSRKVADEVQILHNISSGLGLDMTVLFNEEPALTVAVHAKQQNAAYLVCDLSGAEGTVFLQSVRDIIPETAVVALGADGHPMTFPALTAANAV